MGFLFTFETNTYISVRTTYQHKWCIIFWMDIYAHRFKTLVSLYLWMALFRFLLNCRNFNPKLNLFSQNHFSIANIGNLLLFCTKHASNYQKSINPSRCYSLDKWWPILIVNILRICWLSSESSLKEISGSKMLKTIPSLRIRRLLRR